MRFGKRRGGGGDAVVRHGFERPHRLQIPPWLCTRPFAVTPLGGGGSPPKLSEYAPWYFRVYALVEFLRIHCVYCLSHATGERQIWWVRVGQVALCFGPFGGHWLLPLWRPSHAGAGNTFTHSHDIGAGGGE